MKLYYTYLSCILTFLKIPSAVDHTVRNSSAISTHFFDDIKPYAYQLTVRKCKEVLSQSPSTKTNTSLQMRAHY